MANTLPAVLTIAGSDPSGGAGIEADLKVITAHGCYGMTAITALTAQNTCGVQDIHPIPIEFFQKSLHAVLADMPVDVVKTGMLTSRGHITIVAAAMEEWGIKKLVLDPVMVSTSGHKLLPDDAISTLAHELLPMSYVLTPNIPEALLLLEKPKDFPIKTVDDLKAIAAELGKLGPRYVLLKGGHVPMTSEDMRGESIYDVLYDSEKPEWEVIEKPFLISENTHGTGCSLASAIASNIANGCNPKEAVKEGSRYITWAIETAPGFGKGKGPVNHIHSNYILPFAPGHFLDYLLEHPRVKPIWEEYTRHDFVKLLGAGALKQEQFSYYLKQDYLFLIQFARAQALVGAKSSTMPDIVASAKIINHVHEEMSLHINYCYSFGISEPEILSTEEDIACTAYTRYVLDVGQSHDVLGLLVATAPCLFGYHEIGRWLLEDPATKREGNPYLKWMQNYGESTEYVGAVKVGRELLERKIRAAGVDRLEELVGIFAHATKMEAGFWKMGLEGPGTVTEANGRDV